MSITRKCLIHTMHTSTRHHEEDTQKITATRQQFKTIEVKQQALSKNNKQHVFLRKLQLSNRWCKRENVEPDALKEWKINIFKITDSFYSRNTHLLPPKPKSSFRHLKRGIQDFHMNYVLVPADKAANNIVVV